MRENRSELQIQCSTYNFLKSWKAKVGNQPEDLSTSYNKMTRVLLLHQLFSLILLEQHISKACMFILINWRKR